ncbi:MAG: lytic transglycosylase domain-containing protein [candidate division NC10 bacterium]|nr:lytic transglycosylase domain-containing protein [candidate division NC10 bacterium]
MPRAGSRVALALFLTTCLAPLLPCLAAAGEQDAPSHFPRPSVLQPNVDFWRQVYTEYGLEDFILHDRENMAVIYEVVRVAATANQARAAEMAKSEIQRVRAQYEGIVKALAEGQAPETLGTEAVEVFRLWGCPCPAEALQRAAANIRVQQGLRQKVEEGLRRAVKLMPRILSILRKHEVPEELAALPLVESSFNPAARSKAGAVGMWQFIKQTGKQYLTISRKRDDRRDPIRSTDAAARLLKHNYQSLGSWPLAITAYNHGKEGIRAAREAVGSGAIEDIILRYTGPRFGFASRNFYAEFLAALDVLSPLIQEHGKATSQPRPSPRGLREG